jgi:hypothetical protein
MRATGEGFDTLGLGDKMDLIQMMLDCAETMTSVLDNVTDMGINVNTLRFLLVFVLLLHCQWVVMAACHCY